MLTGPSATLLHSPLKIDQVMQDEAEDEYVAEQKRIFTRETTTGIKEEGILLNRSTSSSSPIEENFATDATRAQTAPRVKRPSLRSHRRRASAIEWKPPDESAIKQRRAKAGLLGSKLHATL